MKKEKADTIIGAYQSGLLDKKTAMYELKQLSDETGMFGSISDDDINAAAGVTWKDDTALKDPTAGIWGEVSGPVDVTVADFMTIDYKGQPRDENGKFTFGKLGGKRKSSLKKQSKSDKMSKREIDLVSSGILTDHPKFEPGSYHGYYYGKYYYIFTVEGPGEYHFTKKIPLS